MKPYPITHSNTLRARPGLRPAGRFQPPRTMRSTVLLSLLLAPDGGVHAHRHGQGSPPPRSR